jgi:hypothetical protein
MGGRHAAPRGGRHVAPRGARPGAAGNAGAAEEANIPEQVLAKLKDAARLERLIAAGVFVALTAVANVPAMGDAAANWRTRLSGEFDKAGNNLLSDIISMSGKDWIADDQKAFVKTMETFKAELETCRKYVETIGSTVDELGDAYRAYWVSIGAMIAAALIALILYKAMELTPQGAVLGEILSKTLGVLVIAFITSVTVSLANILESAGGIFKVIFGGASFVQMFNLKPTGNAAIDFKKAVIDTTPPSTWVEPKRSKPQPYGS